MVATNSTHEKLEDYVLSEHCRDLLDLWKSWRGDALAPQRSDVRFEDLAEALPSTIELEFVSIEQCIYRFVGSDVVELAGVDRTGTNFFTAASADQQTLRIARFLELEKYPCGSLARIQTTLKNGDKMMREALGFPVLPNRTTGNRRLIVVSTPLDDFKWQTPVQEGRILPIATDFHFIDIGAGVPEYSETLRPDAPLTL